MRTDPDPTLFIRVDTTKAMPKESFADKTLYIKNPLVSNQQRAMRHACDLDFRSARVFPTWKSGPTRH